MTSLATTWGGGRLVRWQGARIPTPMRRRGIRIRAAGSDDKSDDSPPPSKAAEKLFTDELVKRGIDPAKGAKQIEQATPPSPPRLSFMRKPKAPSPFREDEEQAGGESTTSAPDPQREGRRRRSDVGSDSDDDQLARSRQLNSEGLSGLPDRASRLLLTGSTLFLNFLPLGLAVTVIFCIGYALLGTDFIHGGEPQRRATYVSPEELLLEPTVDDFVRFDGRMEPAPPPSLADPGPLPSAKE